MAWSTLTMQVTTPLFNAGGDPGGDGDGTCIRAASIRGAMRFWFRALAGCMTGPDLGLLADLERRVFGGASGQGGAPDGAASGESGGASPVLLRIPRQPSLTPARGPHTFLPGPAAAPGERYRSRWLLYLMGQGLANMGRDEVLRPYVPPGREFSLKIGFRHRPGDTAEERAAIEALAFASLWLACAYGGVGARTRRGFGGIRITAADGDLPAPWQETGAILTPGLDHYERLRYLWPTGPLGGCMRHIQALAPGRSFNPRSAWAGHAPSFPVLSPTHTRAATSGGVFGDWADTLTFAGEEFRRFRANKDNTRPSARYRPKIESEEWVNVVNGSDTHFPLGALGLPVHFRSESGEYTVNAESQAGQEPLRRASPLWLRAVGEGDEWRLLSFAFRTQFLPGPHAPGIHLRDVGGHPSRHIKALGVTNADIPYVTDQWIDAMQANQSFAGPRRRR